MDGWLYSSSVMAIWWLFMNLIPLYITPLRLRDTDVDGNRDITSNIADNKNTLTNKFDKPHRRVFIKEDRILPKIELTCSSLLCAWDDNFCTLECHI